jgi:2-aminoadipate transaminase
MNWKLAARAAKMNPSVLREILKVTERPGIISLAGGLPSPKTFPIQAFADACAEVLHNDGQAALQYAASEGYAPLRKAVADMLPWNVDPAQVLITTGSQQGLDLVAKVLIDPGSKVLVETPTYLGALQAFGPMEPNPVSVASDEDGVIVEDLVAKAKDARFVYLLPNFQNPTGRTMTEARRAAVSAAAAEAGLPIIEDNPYGEFWFDEAPPLPLTARNPEGCIYLGSFSKVLAPGLRLGFLVAPKAIYPKLLQAKQAVDLHTPIFTQRMVSAVMKDGFLERHVPTIRALYKRQRDAMIAALTREMAGLDVKFNAPKGGMFLWARLPEGIDTVKLLPKAVERNVAFVPGAPFYAGLGDPRTLRLSFVTASVEEIDVAIAAFAVTLREELALLGEHRSRPPPVSRQGRHANTMIGLATLSLFLLAVLALFSLARTEHGLRALARRGARAARRVRGGHRHLGRRPGAHAVRGDRRHRAGGRLAAVVRRAALCGRAVPGVARGAGACVSGGAASRRHGISGPPASGASCGMALLNNLVNPKALLFFMVFLPQFVDPARGSVALQLVQLGVVLSVAALAFNTLLGACSGQVGRWLQRRPGAEKFQRTLLAVVMFGLAIRLLMLDRPAPPWRALPATKQGH